MEQPQQDKSVHIFLLDSSTFSPAQTESLLDQLTRDEQARYHQHQRAQRKQQFLLGRSLLRHGLHSLFAIHPKTVRITEMHDQAPRLLLPSHQHIHFSVSHSGAWVACALSDKGKLGLDIEQLNRERNFLELAQFIFTSEENAQLQSLAKNNQMQDLKTLFYTLWTCYEARYKLGQFAASMWHLTHAELAMCVCSSYAYQTAPQLHVLHSIPKPIPDAR